MSAVMALLFVSMALPGCLSLVVGREMMESARGYPQVREISTPYDLSHTFVIDGTAVARGAIGSGRKPITIMMTTAAEWPP